MRDAVVRQGRTPDELLLATDAREDRHRVHGQLRSAFPERGWRLGASGVTIPALDAEVLLAPDCPVNLSWTEVAERMVANRRHAIRIHPEVRRQVEGIREGGREEAAKRLGPSEDLAMLDDHQMVDVACMTLEEGFGLCVFDEQGAGKTVTTIFAYDTLVSRDQADLLLIVAPKSMVGEWPNDFQRFVPDRYCVETVSGDGRAKRMALAGDADVLVTNFETVVQLEGELRSLMARANGRAILVIDESFYTKNLDAKRTLGVRRLREWCGRAFVLCGTPAPNKPHDLIQQFSIVDFGITFHGVDVPEDRHEARPIIQQAVEERGLHVRHRKCQVLPDLPNKAFNCVKLPLEPVQNRIYREACEGLIRDLRATDDDSFHRRIAHFLARRSALLQICSNPASVAPGYDELPAKLKALDKILERRIIGESEKVVVWSFYRATIDAIVGRYAAYNPVRYDGTITDVAERRSYVRRFQEDDHTMLFVANPAAAGAGLTLHRARFAVYESMSNQAAHYLQSLDRIHRRGQTRPVEYSILLCDGTIEETEYARITEKEQAAAALLGDPATSSPTRAVMLDELMSMLVVAK